MYLFVEKGIWEGILYIAKRFSKANNKYIKSYHDSKPKPSKYITYLDANDLYGWEISQYLPCSAFEIVKSKRY